MAIGPMTGAARASSVGVGLQTLRSIIDHAARTDFRQLSEDLFTDDEKPHFRFVRQYYHHHGVLPPVATLAEQNLALPATAPAAVGHYMERLYDRARFNVFMVQQPAIVRAVQSRNMTEAVALNGAMNTALTRFTSEQDTFSLAESAAAVVTDYERARTNPGVQGITLGWSYLDELVGGAEPGDVITMYARPGVGKSQLLIHSAYRAWRAGASILFVTNEMKHLQITRRLMGLHSGINPEFIRRGQVSVWASDLIYETATEFGNGAPFHLLSGTFNNSVATMDAAIAELSPDLVVCDASYLMEPVNKSSRMAGHEIAASVVKEIKMVAMRRNRPILQSVQENRTGEISGTDTVLQISSAAIKIGLGEGANEFTQRKLDLVKNREGRRESGSMLINFLFSPPNFDHIPTDENGRPIVDTEEAAEAVWEAA